MGAYYNEFDPFAAQWLRELIKAGHIAKGDVDDRSILDVSAADLRGFDQCHFFAGIGVWSHSLRRAGWSDDRPVWTGSVPCQPLSVAGLGKGHADERHLWPAFHRLIAECRPAIVLGEQVAGKDGREWYSAVRADLEADGYACGGADLCAAGVGAPHIRQRLYWLAHADRQQWNGSGHAGPGGRREPADDSSTVGLADADNTRLEGRRQPGRQRPGQRPAGAGGVAGGLEHLAGDGRLERRPEPGERGAVSGRVTSGLEHSDHQRRGEAGHSLAGQRSAIGSPDGGLADADGAVRGPLSLDRQDGRDGQDTGRQEAHGEPGTRGEVFGLGDTDDRELGALGSLPQGSGTEPDGSGDRPGADHGFWSDADWLYCRDGKWRPVEPGTFPLVDGAPARVGRLRGYGNAINAETAKAFIESVMDLTAISEDPHPCSPQPCSAAGPQ